MCILGGTNLGYFTIYNAFDLIVGTSNPVHMEHCSLIWKLSVHERIRSFIWMIHHNGIKTNKYLSQLKLREQYCDDCTDDEETILHVIRNCIHAKPIWIQLLSIFDNNFFLM